MTSLLVGVDIGTSRSKGVLVRPDGEVVAVAERRHAMSMPHPGRAEMDAESLWWGELVSICRELTSSTALAGGGSAVAAVCVSGIGPCLLPTDADLVPLRPAVLYGVDTRASAEVEELTERLGPDALLVRCGKLLSSQAVGPKLLWLRRHEPEVWARTRAWFGCSSYLVARLTGEYVIDHHTASQCDPLYDLRARDWAHDWVEDVVGDLPMPRLAWPTDVAGEVSTAAAGATGLPVGIPVLAGTIDALAEAVGCGVRTPGDQMLMYGSTMFFLRLLDELRSHHMLWTTTGLEPGTLAVAGGMATSGSLVDWLRHLTGDPDYRTLIAEAAVVPAGSEGLLMLPHFSGERTPIFDPLARGVVAGLTLRHTRGHLLRAAYEGIAFGLRESLRLVDETCGPAQRLVAVGGGIAGGLWTQIVSDVTGREQLVPQVTLGASYGGALMAGIGVGLVPTGTDWTRIARHVVPAPETAARYDDLAGQHRELYRATATTVHRLALLEESSLADGDVSTPR